MCVWRHTNARGSHGNSVSGCRRLPGGLHMAIRQSRVCCHVSGRYTCPPSGQTSLRNASSAPNNEYTGRTRDSISRMPFAANPTHKPAFQVITGVGRRRPVEIPSPVADLGRASAGDGRFDDINKRVAIRRSGKTGIREVNPASPAGPFAFSPGNQECRVPGKGSRTLTSATG